MSDKMPSLFHLRFAVLWWVNIDYFFLICGAYMCVPTNLLILFLHIFSLVQIIPKLTLLSMCQKYHSGLNIDPDNYYFLS